MVGTHDPSRAGAARAIEQARGAVPAHIMKSPDHAIVAADGKQHLADEVETLVIARVRNLGDVTDDLPGGTEHAFALEREEFRVRVRPCRQAEIVG